MKRVPYSGLTRAAEASPAGRAGAEPKFGRQMLPVDPGVEHEQDALQASSVVEWDRSPLPRPVDRQQRLDADP
jgi:hypothetical protein